MPVSVTAPRGLARLAPALRALLSQVLKGEGRRLGEVAIVLSDDELLRQINREWRAIDRATDVISFAYDEREPDAATRPVRGDLVISLDRVRVQAKRYRVTPGAELARLVVHGTLHLCGHDHASAGERTLMRVREAATLRQSGARVRALDHVLGAPRARGGGTMTRGALLAALLLASAGAARAACPPPESVLLAVRSATRVQLEQLGPDQTRIRTRSAHVPGRTLGYEVHGLFRVSGAAAESLREAFGRRDSYACSPQTPAATFTTPEGLPIGVVFAAGRGAAAVVLHLPEGRVEIQGADSVRTSAPLSRLGQRRWEQALVLLARETSTSPEEFYEQMLPPGRIPATPAAPAAPADTASAPRDGPPRPR